MSIARGLLSTLLTIGIIVSLYLGLIILSAREPTIPDWEARETACTAPQGWSAHAVQIGENLNTLAGIVGVEAAELVIANCLQGDLHPGDTIYLPPPSSPTRSCGPPQGWSLYKIQPGDNLPQLAQRFAISETALWHANCITEDMTFPPGFRIYVPAAIETP
jgi:hypothetical protein